jgi:hypothetical protein
VAGWTPSADPRQPRVSSGSPEIAVPPATQQAAPAELAKRLFVPPERWGWEYTKPAPIVRSPDADNPPLWYELERPANLPELLRRRKSAIFLLIVMLVASFVVAGVLNQQVPDWVTNAVFLGGIVLSVLLFLRNFRGFKVAVKRHESKRADAVKQWEQNRAAWEAHVAEFDRKEQERYASSLLWHPLELRSHPSRVDIFGGTGDGWASLLTTLGASMLPNNGGMLVLDFSEQQVADGLAVMAAQGGLPVATIELPAAAEQVNLLGGLSPDEIAELLAESVHTLRTGREEGIDLRALDAELLSTVAQRLEQPATFVRIVAGLRVLRRLYDASTEDVLTAGEVRALNSFVDTVGTTERNANELQFLTSTLALLTVGEDGRPIADGAAQAVPLWPVRGLMVVGTMSSHHRRKDLLDRVVFHRVLHAMRTLRPGGPQDVIAIAGADHVGLESLEALARHARRIGVRLIFLLEHLRGDLVQLLGGSDSAALVMRLGNASEAAAAADFIGREHRFELSQLTEQIGQTFTHGTATSEGGSVTNTSTSGFSSSSSFGGSSGGGMGGVGGGGGSSFSSSTFGTSSSRSVSRMRSWQETVNQSEADSTSRGQTQARVYEYAVEPTTIQGLPPTAFILVEVDRSGRRVVGGDCNPGIALLPRLAAMPRRP